MNPPAVWARISLSMVIREGTKSCRNSAVAASRALYKRAAASSGRDGRVLRLWNAPRSRKGPGMPMIILASRLVLEKDPGGEVTIPWKSVTARDRGMVSKVKGTRLP